MSQSRQSSRRSPDSIIAHELLESRMFFSIPAGLNGSGVRVAQVEADLSSEQFEVNPAAVNQPASLFTYTSAAGTATGTPPPNAAGIESDHADAVGRVFYGAGTSAAPGVSHVYNYEANYFINNIIGAKSPQNIPAKVINQSFVATDQNGNPVEDPPTDQAYDNYIAEYNKIIVSSAGNFGPPDSPSTSYNGISVGSSDFVLSTGPTADGRSKPDITAPGSATSYTAPQVAAAAAVLVQAGQTRYGGWNTSAATDSRMIKALLLNGADKPAGWTHTPTQPLDPRYGAGVLDLSNSLTQLEAGQDWMAIPTLSPIGGSHSPISLPFLATTKSSGWDFNTIASGSRFDTVNNYLFNVRGSSGSTDALTATLTWNRQANQASINNLDLYLYNTDTHTLVSESVSGVDNVEELYTAGLTPGHYDLEVLKHGGTPGVTPGDVSNSETYAMAFNFAGATSTNTGGGTSWRPWFAVDSASGAASGPALSVGSTHVLQPAIQVVSSPVVTATGSLTVTTGTLSRTSTTSPSEPDSSQIAFGHSLVSGRSGVASAGALSQTLTA